MFNIIETLHMQSIFLSSASEDSLRDSKLPVTPWVPEDQGTGIMASQCMKLVLVSFTNLLSYIIIVISH